MNESTASVSNYAPIPESGPMVNRRLSSLATAINMLGDEIGVLTKRLQPVVRPEENGPSEGELCAVDEPLSPVADDLRRMERHVEILREVVKNATEKLEI